MEFEWDPRIDDELRPEYDETVLKEGVRGKYVARYQQGTNLILLAPDVAAVFPTEKAVNDALRLLMKVAQINSRDSLRLMCTVENKLNIF